MRPPSPRSNPASGTIVSWRTGRNQIALRLIDGFDTVMTCCLEYRHVQLAAVTQLNV